MSQIGYLLMGLGLFTALALGGALYFMVHVVLAKSALFLVSGVVHRIQGTYQLKRLGGLYHACPGLSILFLIPALSLAGIPPLSGFWAKLTLIRAGLETQQYLIVAVALGVSLLTLFSMIKIWGEAFWKPSPVALPAPRRQPAALMLPIAGLALLTVVIGLAAEPLFALAMRAAEQLLNPADYIHAVLGGGM